MRYWAPYALIAVLLWMPGAHARSGAAFEGQSDQEAIADVNPFCLSVKAPLFAQGAEMMEIAQGLDGTPIVCFTHDGYVQLNTRISSSLSTVYSGR